MALSYVVLIMLYVNICNWVSMCVYVWMYPKEPKWEAVSEIWWTTLKN